MNDSLYEMIFRRKSFHSFRNVDEEHISDEELAGIMNAYAGFIPLISDIRTAVRIVPAEETSCRRGEEYCVLLYSEVKDGYLQNIGYLGEQLDLWLVSHNIGTLWFGIGKPDEDEYEEMKFVIMIAIRKISDDSRYRKDMYKSKRKTIDEIWEGRQIEGVTEIVRFTPSACNTQPWIVESNEQELRVFRYKKPGKRGIMPADKVSFYNRIDIGIFLLILEVCLKHGGIVFERTLFEDKKEEEKNLVAIYAIK
jgi:hypothetical protein